MSIQIDTAIGNKPMSEKLKGMLVDLRDKAGSVIEDIEDRIEKINVQGRSEGFEGHEIDLLLRMYLSEIKTKRQLKWILTDKPRIKEQKKLTDKRDINVPIDDNNVPSIPAPDYSIVVPDQVIDEVINEQEQFEAIEALRPNYEVEELKLKVDTLQDNLDQERADKKQLEEKYKQLEAKTRVPPTNNIPAVQGNTLRTKVVVSDVFREILKLKGSKGIYANVVIDTSQNKYIRLEPL
jgi:hypothetical protein